MAVRLTAALMTVCVGILPPDLLAEDESAEERPSGQIVAQIVVIGGKSGGGENASSAR